MGLEMDSDWDQIHGEASWTIKVGALPGLKQIGNQRDLQDMFIPYME